MPLWKETAKEIQQWLKYADLHVEQPLIPNRSGLPMTRTNVAERLNLAVSTATKMCPQLAGRRIQIAEDWAGSLTIGVGQFCTNPGLILLPEGLEGDNFIELTLKALAQTQSQPMLTEAIAENFSRGKGAMAAFGKGELDGLVKDRNVAAAVVSASASEFMANPILSHGVFGPSGLIVRTPDSVAMIACAKALIGQLTCTIQMEENDQILVEKLLPILEPWIQVLSAAPLVSKAPEYSPQKTSAGVR